MIDLKKESLDNNDRILAFKLGKIFTQEDMRQVSGGVKYKLEPTLGYNSTTGKLEITDHSEINLPW